MHARTGQSNYCVYGGGKKYKIKGGKKLKVFTGHYVRGSQLLQIKLANPICYTFMVQTDILTSINMSMCMMAETKHFLIIFSFSPTVQLQKS